MKYLFGFILLVLQLLLCNAEIRFTDNLDQALKRAKKEQKLVFVELYTNWCASCKVLEEHVFSDPLVSSLYNTTFINVKLNAEGQGREMASKYGIGSFPGLLFLDDQGELVYQGRAVNIQTMTEMAQRAMDPAFHLSSMTPRFEEGDRTKQFLLDYLTVLRDHGELLKYSDVFETYYLAGHVSTDNELFEMAKTHLFTIDGITFLTMNEKAEANADNLNYSKSIDQVIVNTSQLALLTGYLPANYEEIVRNSHISEQRKEELILRLMQIAMQRQIQRN